jgi:Peptidase_C39 like family
VPRPLVAALFVVLGVTVSCVSRWDAGGVPLASSGSAGGAAIVPAVEMSAASPALGREGGRSPLAEVAGVVEPGGTTETDSAVGLQLIAAMADRPVQVISIAEAGDTASRSSIRMSLPFHTQKDGDRFQGSNCGPAALGMVLEAFGMVQGNAELRFLTHTYQGTVGARTGTALQHMAHVAADYGLEPIGLYQRPDGLYGKEGFARWTVDDIRTEVLAGRPVIPLVKFRLLPGHEDSPFRADHYVVIYGVDGDSFLYHDPIFESPWEGAARWMSADQLAAAMKPTLVPQQAVAFGAGSRTALTLA